MKDLVSKITKADSEKCGECENVANVAIVVRW